MATGAPGTNGVWQYGEDDSEATFSALLNKAASTTNTAIGLDRGRLTTLEARALSGIVPVVPSTIANVSGSSSFNSTTGLVTFTGVSAISLNSIFTSAYRNYRLDYTITLATGTGGSLLFRLRSGGVNRTDSNHQTTGTQAQSTNVISSYAVNGGTSLDLGFMTVLANSFTAGTMNISDPQQTLMTKMVSSLIGVSSGNATGYWQLGLAHHLAQSHDGFTLYTATGSLMTGTLKVYGYN
jgi:hypothetical protein